jgi:uncharacterized protein (DUF2147 family)
MIQSGKGRYRCGRMGGSKVERVCTDVEEWEDPKWKGYVQMWENGRIQSGKGRYRCGRIGGSTVERVCTDVGEWDDPKWKG